MSKKISFVAALAGICALSLFLLNCGSTSSRPSGLLYVVTQGTNSQGVVTGLGNNVSSFSIDENSGNLSLINSNASTCPTPATDSNSEPCGIPLQILLDPTGKVAFVLDQGLASVSPPVAPAIYSFNVTSDGSLGSPTLAATLTTLDTPVAMTRDAAGQFLFVIDKGSDPSATSCQYLPPDYPTIQCGSISVFAMQTGSTSLTEAPGSPFPVGRIPSALSALSFTPTTPAGAPPQEFLYVTSNLDPALHLDSTLNAYSVDSSGNLTDLTPDSPYITATNPISVLAVNTFLTGESTNGVFVYVGSQANESGSLSVFQVCTVENAVCNTVNLNDLVPVGEPTSLGQNPVAMLVDPTNSFLYVTCYVSNQIYGYRINPTAGTLTAQSPAYEPTGSGPVSMAMHPSISDTGQFIYTSNTASSNITGFAVSTTTGSMSNPITVIAPAAPSGMAAD
jgi:6-phosphogluconolactonase (cycloisomerase 2 family)